MYQCILIATDGSTLSRKAVDSGVKLAELTGAEVVALNVISRYSVSTLPVKAGVSVEQHRTESAVAVVEGVKTLAATRGVKVKAVTTRSDMVGESIIAAAKKYKCDLIVMASHGRRGLTRLLMGSETTHVLTHSHIPVLVLRKFMEVKNGPSR